MKKIYVCAFVIALCLIVTSVASAKNAESKKECLVVNGGTFSVVCDGYLVSVEVGLWQNALNTDSPSFYGKSKVIALTSSGTGLFDLNRYKNVSMSPTENIEFFSNKSAACEYYKNINANIEFSTQEQPICR